MPCIHPPVKDSVEGINEESFIKKDGGKLRVRIFGDEGPLETTMEGSLKSVEEIAGMLGVEPDGDRIEAVVNGTKVIMERGRLQLEFENGEKMLLENV
ncbi:hypothetical protein E3E29_07340 [Thermococcus sp. Bubb.Bath]|nr:hypothetical protein [Thermococcus sp. Bubb.Bath]NJF25451.1 hypothetical protein [Thermococcus sp. Bubb.Bath]